MYYYRENMRKGLDEKMTKEKRLNTLTLAFGIALMPPLWAVISPYFGVTTGAVALICAGLYVANGNQIKNALPISLGFLMGDIWAVTALKTMDIMQFNADAELYVTLFVLGALAVIIGTLLEKFIFVPSWLCGWAIGLTIMAPVGIEEIETLPVQIGVAMLAGVWYVGVGVDLFQKFLLKILKKKS